MATYIKQVEPMGMIVHGKFKGAYHQPWYDCVLR